MIRDEKLQYTTNREAAKVSALSSGKVDKYQYLTGEEILLIEKAKFTYSCLGKAFQIQTKTIENTAEKQRKTTEDAAKK